MADTTTALPGDGAARNPRLLARLALGTHAIVRGWDGPVPWVEGDAMMRLLLSILAGMIFGLTVAVSSASAQERGRVYKIGWLFTGRPNWPSVVALEK